MLSTQFCKEYCLEQHLDMDRNDPISRAAEDAIIGELLAASHHAEYAEEDQNQNVNTNTTMRNVLLTQIWNMGICRPAPIQR